MLDGQYSRAQLDAMARQAGFHDYETWAGYQRTRDGIIGAGGHTGIAPQQAPKNWFQKLLEMIPWHPVSTLGYTNDKINKAKRR